MLMLLYFNHKIIYNHPVNFVEVLYNYQLTH